MTSALIGAGAAGSACVSVLRSRGTDCLVFEKARGVGGRLATRRVNLETQGHELCYDHGAPIFQLDTNLQNLLFKNIKSSVLQAHGNGFVSCPTMPQLIKELLGNTPVHTQIEIAKIEGRPRQWFLVEKVSTPPTLPQSVVESNSRTHAANSGRVFGPFEKVIFTAPGPQTWNLISHLPCAWSQELTKITYNPCWALMFSAQKKLESASILEPVELDSKTNDFFSSLSLQNLKPSRSLPDGIQSWVAHASPEWSLSHLEESSERVLATLLPRALERLNIDAESVLHSAVHRWRFSTVKQHLNSPFLEDDVNGLFFAGDACLGSSVADSLQSGFALGKFLVR